MKKILLSAAACLLAAGLLADATPGKPAPSFELRDVNGGTVSLSGYKGKYVVLEWVNHGCPFVRRHYASGNMQRLQKQAAAEGVVWLSICSSGPGKQGNFTAAEWGPLLKEKGSAAAATLLDPDGRVGRTYGAKTTPHVFVVDPAGRLIYRGAIDDKPSTDVEEAPGARNYVRQALDEARAGKPVSEPSTDSYGCSVKYQ